MRLSTLKGVKTGFWSYGDTASEIDANFLAKLGQNRPIKTSTEMVFS